MDEDLIIELVETIPNSISILACLWFFYSYMNVRKRTLGLLMILTLSISDIIFHISMLFLTWYNAPLEQTIADITSNTALKFSIFWASNIAYFLYRLLTLNERAEPQKYYRISLVLLLSLAFFLAVVCQLFGSSFTAADMVVMTIALPFSVGFTLFYYLKSIPKLREVLTTALLPTHKPIKALYLYSFVQLITICPLIVCSLIKNLGNVNYFIPECIASILVGFSGLANSLVYFFQRVCTDKPINQTTTSFESELSQSKSIENGLYQDAHA